MSRVKEPQPSVIGAMEDSVKMVEPSIYKETKELPVPEGEEGMMVGVSLIQEEPHHHGGLCSLVPNHATIPVKGVECGGVLGVQ